jgi:hypothetical protein
MLYCPVSTNSSIYYHVINMLIPCTGHVIGHLPVDKQRIHIPHILHIDYLHMNDVDNISDTPNTYNPTDVSILSYTYIHLTNKNIIIYYFILTVGITVAVHYTSNTCCCLYHIDHIDVINLHLLNYNYLHV